MQFYSDPSRETSPTALPDAETFSNEEGWFYWYVFPGCLPDSDPIGPFESENAAIAACQEECAT